MNENELNSIDTLHRIGCILCDTGIFVNITVEWLNRCAFVICLLQKEIKLLLFTGEAFKCVYKFTSRQVLYAPVRTLWTKFVVLFVNLKYF